jgi:protein-tyrosine phosphatase
LSGYVDIHAHVLPGVDDGPEDVAETLALARAAHDSGIHTLAATPHLRADFPDVHVHQLAERCQAVRDALTHEAIALELVCGAEVSLAWALEASDDELRLASYGQRGTDLLIETPSNEVGGLAELVYRIRLRGFRVTLAHPERSASFQSDVDKLADLVAQGVLLQVNASSLRRGHRGSPLHRLATRLCHEGLVHAIASDAHRATSWRPVTELASTTEALTSLVGPARTRWLTHEAPAAILAGDQLPEAPPIPARSLTRRLLRR